MMSVDLGGLINKIPQEKLNELVNKFTDGATAQEILDFLSSAGIDASDEEVHALKESLLLKDSELLAVSDESMKEVVGGKEDPSISWRESGQPDSDEHQARGKCPFCCY